MEKVKYKIHKIKMMLFESSFFSVNNMTYNWSKKKETEKLLQARLEQYKTQEMQQLQSINSIQGMNTLLGEYDKERNFTTANLGGCEDSICSDYYTKKIEIIDEMYARAYAKIQMMQNNVKDPNEINAIKEAMEVLPLLAAGGIWSGYKGYSRGKEDAEKIVNNIVDKDTKLDEMRQHMDYINELEERLTTVKQEIAECNGDQTCISNSTKELNYLTKEIAFMRDAYLQNMDRYYSPQAVQPKKVNSLKAAAKRIL